MGSRTSNRNEATLNLSKNKVGREKPWEMLEKTRSTEASWCLGNAPCQVAPCREIDTQGSPSPSPISPENLPQRPFCFPRDYFFSQRESSCLSCYFYEMLFSLRGQEGKLEPPVAHTRAEQPPAGSCTVGFPSAPGKRGLSSPNPPRAKAHFSSPQFARPVKN